MSIEHVPGRKAGNVMLYALSTCGWCRKTRELLNELGVEYDYVYVDQLQGGDRAKAAQEAAEWNPSRSYPILVIDDQKCIVGYKEDDIREALKG